MLEGGATMKIKILGDGPVYEAVYKILMDHGAGYLHHADADADLGILAWWPHILKEPELSAPRLGWLNLHPSLLPYGRGKHPASFALLDETPFGVTIHWVSEKVDEGDVAWQRQILYDWTVTAGDLYATAQTAIVELFEEHVDSILAGDIPRVKQRRPAKYASDWPTNSASDIEPMSEVDLEVYDRYDDQPVREALNTIRARTYPDGPGAWFVDNGVRYRVMISIKRDDLTDSEG